MITLSASAARCFMLVASGLDAAFFSVAEALDHLGFVQMDPINVCGRMQDHILRHRVRDYREHGLMEHLHASRLRTAFEQHLPGSNTLVALPLDAWPHLQRTMRSRAGGEGTWSGKLTAEETKLAASLLARMATGGPLCSQDIASDRKAKSHAWDSTTLAKSTLQKLFFHGRVLIARREMNRRYYALPEHVLPASCLHCAMPTETDTARWLALLKLRQRRLAVLKAAEQRAIADEVIPVTIKGATAPRLHILRSDAAVLERSSLSAEAALIPRLLAPLDPIIYDRRVTESVWDFDYRWEVYTPPQKRVRGYYALPLLHGHRFIGHADLKADRAAGVLQVVSRQTTAAFHASRAIRSLAGFLGLDGIK